MDKHKKEVMDRIKKSKGSYLLFYSDNEGTGSIGYIDNPDVAKFVLNLKIAKNNLENRYMEQAFSPEQKQDDNKASYVG